MLDVTISKREGDLILSVGPVENWYPTDDQLETIRQRTISLIEELKAGN